MVWLSWVVPVRFRSRVRVVESVHLLTVDRFHGAAFTDVVDHWEVTSFWQWRGRTFRSRTRSVVS